MGNKDNFKRGSVALIVLSLLSEGDMYGYQLSQLMEERSNGNFVVPEGSLYPTLYKLTREGHITDKKVQVGQRLVRVYYHIEPSGLEYLSFLLEEYYKTKDSIEKILSEGKGGISDAE